MSSLTPELPEFCSKNDPLSKLDKVIWKGDNLNFENRVLTMGGGIQHATKHLSTWQQNNLQKEIDKKIAELYPAQNPKDKEIAELKQAFAQMQKDSERKELTNSALKIAGEKSLPLELIDFMVGDSEEITNANIAKLEAVFASTVNKMVEEKLKGKTPSSGGGSGSSEIDALETERQLALKNGNMPMAISIKNKIVALQNKK